MMKLVVLACVAALAAAEAEADPALLYGSYGYPYAGVYGGYRAYGAYPATYGYGLGHGAYSYGKRSADAEPEADAEADPALLYGAYGYPYAGAYGGYRTYGAYPATYGYGYRTYGAYPYSYYGKRSADAEPEAEAKADPALLYTTSNVVRPQIAYAGAVRQVVPQVVNYAAVPQVATHYTVPVTTVAKAVDHGVASTYAGLVHSSHVGVCLNNLGVQVAC